MDEAMDEVFKSEVILVVMEKEEGVSFNEFAGLFHQVHGYQLKLTNYGYKSLKDLLDTMKDEVEIQNVNGQQLIKCRPPCPLNVIAPDTDISSQKNEPFVSGSCSTSSNKCWPQSGNLPLDEFPKKQPSCKQNAPEIRCQSQEYLASEASCTKHTCLTRKQMPLNKMVNIISQKMKSHPTGLRAAKLRQYVLEQHKVDLELYSQELGYTDMLSMLIEIPVIKFRNTSGKNIIIASNLFEDQDTPSAKVELCNAGPSSTSKSTSSAKHSAQPDVSSNKKNTNQEHLGSIASPPQKNNPIISECKTEFTRSVNHTQPHKEPTPNLPVDGNAKKKKNPNPTQKYHNSQPEPPKKDHFSLNKVVDALRLFPSGLRIEKLKQLFLNIHIDLEALSKELGYSDMPSMLKQVPGITSINGDVFFASNIPKSKEQLAPVKKVKFSEKLLVDFLKMFPCGLKVENLRQHIKTKYKIDLMKYSQEKGATDMVDMLQKVPGIKVLNKNLIFAMDVYKKSKSKSNATFKATTAKCPINVAAGVTKSHVKIKMPQTAQTVAPRTIRPPGTSQQFLPAPQIPIPNALINSPKNVHQGLRPDVSYASACKGNLGKNQVNVQSPQCSPTFNVQQAHTAKKAHHREVPKDVMLNSNIKDKLRLLLKSHTKGLSIFQLKKLFLLKFQEPLVGRGASVRKLLKNMKDVAIIKGVGVQMKVFPVLSEVHPSASANICSDSTPQEAAVSSSLSIKNNTEHIKHNVPVLLSRQQPSSSEYSHIALTGDRIPVSSSGDIGHKQPLCHITEICDKKMVTTTISHTANSLHPAGNAENINDAQWPSLPQKFNILKEIKQRTKVSDQLPENIPNNKPCPKPNPTATSQPQEDNSAQTLLKAQQEPNKTHSKIDYRQQEPQTSDLAHPIQQPDFSFVLEETGFSFLMGKTNIDKDKKSMEMGSTSPPPNMFTDLAPAVSELSGKDAKKNTHATPIQPNQSAQCNMAAPEASRHSVNVLPQQSVSDFSSKKVPQQTDTHAVTSGFSTPNQKSNNSQSQQCPTHNNNKIFDSLLLDPKRKQVTQTQTCLTSLQAQSIPPSSSSVQMVSMPSKEQQETSSSKSISEFGQRRSTPIPSKQEVAKSNLKNKNGLTVSPKSQSPEKAAISKNKTKVGTQHVPPENSLSGVQETSNGRQASSPVSQIQQVSIKSVDTKGSPLSDTLHKDVGRNIVNEQMTLKTQKKENLETIDGVDGAKIPPSSAQQKVNTGLVFTHEKTVTNPFQTRPKVPDPHTSSSMEQSRSSPRIHHYCNGTAGTAPKQEQRFTSESHQHVAHWDYSAPPVLSGHPVTPTNQQDSSDDSSEESTETWQTDSNQYCCIL